MAERASVFERVQLGVETTEGTAVAANRYLPSLGVVANVDIPTTRKRPAGGKLDALVVPGKEMVRANLTGGDTYDEMAYLLSSLIAYAAPAQEGSTTAYTQAAGIAQSAPDTIKSYTIEKGSSVRAEKFSGAVVTSLQIEGTAETLSVSGTAIGKALTDGITLTTSPTSIPLVPILPTDVSVYLDDDHGDIGTTKLTRDMKWVVNIGNRFGPVKTVDADEPSYSARVELAPDATVVLTLVKDAVGMGLLDTLRSGGTKYLRVEAISDIEAGTSIPHRLALDFALQFEAMGDEADNEGVLVNDWTGRLITDADIPGGIEFELTNTRSAL